MRRVALAVAAALAAAISAAIAQGDPITARKAQMDNFGRVHYGGLARMVSGQLPYDQAKVDEAFEVFAEGAPRITTFFPDNLKPKSVTNDGYDASPKIWDNKADFEAKAAAFAKTVAENSGKAQNLDTLRPVFASINESCNNCHQTYRLNNR